MKKTLLLFFLIIGISCNKKNKNNPLPIQKKILNFYNIALNDTLPLEHRVKAISKSFALSKEFPNNTIHGKILYQKNVINISLQQYDSLEFYNKILVQHALKTNDYELLARQNYLMGYYNESITHLPYEAFKYYNSSKNYFRQTKNNLWIGICLLRMGIIQQDWNDYFGSKETLTEAIGYLNIANDSVYITSALNELATNHRKLLNFNEAIKYFEFAIKKSKSEKDILAYKNNLAITYSDAKNYRNAFRLLNEISLDSILKKSSSQYARIMDNLVYVKWLSNKKITEKEFQAPLKIRKQSNDQRGQLASYTHLGEFYYRTNTTKATSYFDSVIRLSKKLNIPRAEADALKALMDLKPNNVDIRDRYVFLKDSLYTQEMRVKTQFAKYKYDDKITQEENLRLEKEYAEKELELAKQRNQKLAFSAIGGLLLLTLVFLSYYFVQRTKRLRKEKETAALHAMHETEAEFSRRLHDDFGGKLNNIMVMLQNKTDTAKVLDVVDELYNQSRDFSREINVVDTGKNFEDELLEMLRFRTHSDAKLIHSGITAIKWSSIAPISKTTLFKVLQELMINMGKYSNATFISIAFSATPKALKVNYADDGIGASAKDLKTRNGLRNTEKRIQALRGSITFDSEEGNGFRAEIKIPK